MSKSSFFLVFLATACTLACDKKRVQTIERESAMQEQKVIKSESEWKSILTPEAFHVLREKGTERAFTGKYHDFHGKGIYVCAACDNPLFKSTEKYDSGTGWPSFWQPISSGAVEYREDKGLFSKRTEVVCGRCGGHLGHVFDDGPPPTGKRYCMNSAALKFKEDPQK